ncbi:hypothetical protein CLV24_106173 [Pontibacter ummariensis]|uniref:Outer membrane protein beta-barrel domain-containing protein n=1 Tax=Pontibacter ummariensis TaxID=1610492 RepID=A0A239EJA0_9BACT|nr:hypothetical protein [Pontibacter ummariensis]PRY13258.1 hypothetical protein CLV24_106173 [Pontibacter ummariensis]SNS43972.1 hypothetical protein SAMN06296052_106173 [Pontibacter ummariensis]
MKTKLLLPLLLLLAQLSFAQTTTRSVVGFGTVVTGNGDLPGPMLLLGTQRKLGKRIGYEIMASGSSTQGTRFFAPGYTIEEKSKGMSLDGGFHLYLHLGRLTFYPAIGPSIRFARERYMKSASIRQVNGQVVEFESEVVDEHQVQLGGMLALNIDARLTDKYSLGLRGSVHTYHTGQRLAFVGFTLKKTGWWF